MDILSPRKRALLPMSQSWGEGGETKMRRVAAAIIRIAEVGVVVAVGAAVVRVVVLLLQYQ